MPTSKTLESKEQKKVIDWCKANGIWIVKYPAGIYGSTGTPDLIACVKGKFVAIEMKRKGGKIRAMQLRNQEQISKAGGICEIFEGAAEAIEFIESLVGIDGIREAEQDQERAEFMTR